MRTPKEIIKDREYELIVQMQETDRLIKELNECHNKAVIQCYKSATAYITQESVNGGKVAKVNNESILKNLKK